MSPSECHDKVCFSLSDESGVLRFESFALVAVFLFLAVWIPCCTSDIVFPLLFATRGPEERTELRDRPS